MGGGGGGDVFGIGGIAQGAGTVVAANSQADAARSVAGTNAAVTREQLAEQKRQFDITNKQEKAIEEARRQAFLNSKESGRLQMGEGESAFNNISSAPSEALETMSSDIASGNAEELQQGARQMGANLALQGVRGGQAATLLNRGSGQQAVDAQRRINELKYQDESTRKAAQMAFQAAKAQRGQASALQTSGF